LSFPDVCRRYAFIASHNGNCITVNGTSLIIVTDHPRYRPIHTPEIPIVRRCDKMPRRADRDDGYCPACARCFTTSVGTRTAHAATSPRLAAIICSTGAAQS
jgi:hypothetical protein